ncbi:MAG: branched-chain amino acid ABC transporter permease [Candidatus Bathyarchaeia archaeon]
MAKVNRKISSRNIVAVILILLVGIIPLLLRSSFILRILTLYAIYIILAQAVNLLAGYTGYFNFGNAAFFGLGAYTTAVIIRSVGNIGLPLGMLCGAGLAATVALAFSPLFRLHGIFFGMATMFVNTIIREYIKMRSDLGGTYGIDVSLPGISFDIIWGSTYIFMVFVILMIYRFSISKIGRACKAIRDDELLAECIGIYPLRYKVAVFAISAAIAAIAGGFYLSIYQFISPSIVFDPVWSIQCLNMMLIGGEGTILGPIFGAIFFTTLSVTLVGLKELQMLIFAAIVIFVIAFAPGGFMGIYEGAIKIYRGEKKIEDIFKIPFLKKSRYIQK